MRCTKSRGNGRRDFLRTTSALLVNIANLSIPLYLKRQTNNASIKDDQPQNFAAAWEQRLTDGRVF